MRMPVGSRLTVSMSLSCKLGGNHHDTTVTDATFSNDAVREPSHVSGAALQHRNFHAVLMIEMNVERRLCQIMTVVRRLHEPLGQIARCMVVDEDKRAHAVATLSRILCGLLYSGASKVPDRLRSVLISPPFNDPVKVRHQVVVESNGNALHNESPDCSCGQLTKECSELDLR
jgi:hypothetical protein